MQLLATGLDFAGPSPRIVPIAHALDAPKPTLQKHQPLLPGRAARIEDGAQSMTDRLYVVRVHQGRTQPRPTADVQRGRGHDLARSQRWRRKSEHGDEWKLCPVSGPEGRAGQEQRA